MPTKLKSKSRPGRDPIQPHNEPPGDSIDTAEQDWTTDVSEESALIYALSTRILHVASLVERSFEGEAQRAGLNTGEMLVLDTLRRLGPPYAASPAQLKRRFLLSFAGIGKRINRLEELGYVKRGAHATDRRSQTVHLTDSGLALLYRSENDPLMPHRRSLMDLTSAELKSLSRILKKVQQGIELAKSQDTSSDPETRGA